MLRTLPQLILRTAPSGYQRAAVPAFTLVELLIVVIILGILAAVVIPQFNKTTDEAKLSGMVTNLEHFRKQLELYEVQHNGAFPSLAQFTAQLTTKTNPDGTTGGTPKLGPYLNIIPKNPFTDLNDVTNGGVGTSSWYYDETTGDFRANCHASHFAY